MNSFGPQDAPSSSTLSALGVPFNFRSASLRTGCNNNHDVSSRLIVPAFTNYSCPAAPSLLCHQAGHSIFEVFIIFEIFQGANSKSKLSIVSEDTQISSDDLIFGNIYTYKTTLTTSG